THLRPVGQSRVGWDESRYGTDPDRQHQRCTGNLDRAADGIWRGRGLLLRLGRDRRETVPLQLLRPAPATRSWCGDHLPVETGMSGDHATTGRTLDEPGGGEFVCRSEPHGRHEDSPTTRLEGISPR